MATYRCATCSRNDPDDSRGWGPCPVCGESRYRVVNEDHDPDWREQQERALLQHGRSDEATKVEAWRLDQLAAAGYPFELAEKLASDGSVDLHRAVWLLERGCPPDVAYELLT